MKTADELELEIKDSLINAVPRVGGEVGVISDEGLDTARLIGLVGEAGCLTRKGAVRARREQRKYWGE